MRPWRLCLGASLPWRCGRPVGVGFSAVLQMASLASPSRLKQQAKPLSRSALRARNALVLEHLPLADALATATARRLFPLAEREYLIQVAREVLVRSAPRCRAGEPAGPCLGRCIIGALQHQRTIGCGWCLRCSGRSRLAQQAQRLHHLQADADQPGPGPHRIRSAPVGAPVVLSDAALEMGRHTLRNGDIAGPGQSQRCARDHHFSRHGVEERSGTGQDPLSALPSSSQAKIGKQPFSPFTRICTATAVINSPIKRCSTHSRV
jgi:hypothetical protein